MRKYIFIVSALMTSVVQADNWSGGVLAGVSDTGDFCNQFEDVACDKDQDFSYGAFLGRDIGQYFRVEGFFQDLGTARVEDKIDVPDSATVAVMAIGVSAMGRMSITNELEAYGKVGAVRSFVGEHRLERTGFMFSSDGTGTVLGFGGAYRLSDDYSIRFGWDRFNIDNITKLEIDAYTAGFEMNF